MTDHVLWTTAEVSDALSLSPAMVRWYFRAGQLRALRWPTGRLLRFWAEGLADPVPTVSGIHGVEEVAEVLRVHKDVVYTLAQQGIIPMSRRLFGWAITSGGLLHWMRLHSDGQHDQALVRRLRQRKPVYFEVDLDSDLSLARVTSSKS